MRTTFSIRRLAVSACCLVGAVNAPSAFAEPKSMEAKILDNNGKDVGKVKLTQGTTGVLIDISVSGLTPGYHGMHFHAVGDCSDHAAFKTAGGHVDPHKKPHGFLNPQGPHEGNLPNLIVGKDGTAEVELYSQMVSLTDGASNLLDADGSSLIIHKNQDDHMTQPIGGSGDRVACAVVK